ncbi:MAG: hypothetical protein R3C56_26625 [Pirellulaceae bacterium]
MTALNFGRQITGDFHHTDLECFEQPARRCGVLDSGALGGGVERAATVAVAAATAEAARK